MTTPQTYTLVAFKPSVIGEVPEWSFPETFYLEEGLTLEELVDSIIALRLIEFDPDDQGWDTIRYFATGEGEAQATIEALVDAKVEPVLSARRAALTEQEKIREEEQSKEDQKNLEITLGLLDALGLAAT